MSVVCVAQTVGLCDGGLSCEVIFQDVLQKHQLLMGVMVPVGELMACSGCEVVLPHGVLGGARGWGCPPSGGEGVGAGHGVCLPYPHSIPKEFLFLLLSGSAWSFIIARKQAEGPSTAD